MLFNRGYCDNLLYLAVLNDPISACRITRKDEFLSKEKTIQFMIGLR